MTIRFLAPAQAELAEAIEWYAKQAPGLGDAFLLETLKTLHLLNGIRKPGTASAKILGVVA
ncbi:MAG TPA: hypothetical protein VFU97_15260 [Xanthobacteraceae bacterium]|nr:hypothetical protein [Xanthobacteraceae bacterium]